MQVPVYLAVSSCCDADTVTKCGGSLDIDCAARLLDKTQLQFRWYCAVSCPVPTSKCGIETD